MPGYRIDPLQDARWEEFLQNHLRASIFHTPGWLEALRRSYGYEPIAFTTSPPGQKLANGIVFSRVSSWLTGTRLVSVAFADHCQPLVGSADEFAELVAHLQQALSQEKCRYFELRCRASDALDLGASAGLTKSASYTGHSLDLRPDLESLFRGFHPSCVQRKVRRAQRENLTCDEGTSDHFLDQFYSLFVMTRRRHGLPPPPLSWFRNLRDCLGSVLKIRVVSHNGRPVASIVTIHYKHAIVYKYGCSDARFHRLGGMPLLFWRTIQEGKELGARELDLGRSDLEGQGLITFKDHLGAASSTLNYYRYPPQSARSGTLRRMAIVPKVFASLPDSWLRAAGKILYRHVG
jgi:hypothetical protein